MLSAHNLSYRLDDKPLLSDVTLTLQKGRFYGVIGHNGSGKSTLIKLLAGEHTPTSGQVTYDDGEQTYPLHAMPNKERAKRIAYLPQRLPETQGFTVQELVMLGRYPWQKWLQKPSRTDIQMVATAMQQTKIEHKATQTVSTLSGGERARAWLAMCLAQQTDFLLLDEPLSALDIVYQVDILRLMKHLVAKQGLGVVVILHDINLASQFCDDCIALKHGKLCYADHTGTMMTRATLHRIFGIDLHLMVHPVFGHKVAVV